MTIVHWLVISAIAIALVLAMRDVVHRYTVKPYEDKLMPNAPPTHNPGTHNQAKAYDTARKSLPYVKWRKCRRWRKVRAIKLARDPLCECCLRTAHTTAATQVHHRKPAHQCGVFEFHDLANLQSICTRCHALLSAKERQA